MGLGGGGGKGVAKVTDFKWERFLVSYSIVCNGGEWEQGVLVSCNS